MASNLSTDQIISAMEQLSPAELEKLMLRVIALQAARRAPHLEPEESRLLARINEGLPADLLARIGELEEKRDTDLLSEVEAEELLTLSDRAELLHAERLEALADLAKLRGTTLTVLMNQLGIRFPDNA
jgi:hypothetical protein